MLIGPGTGISRNQISTGKDTGIVQTARIVITKASGRKVPLRQSMRTHQSGSQFSDRLPGANQAVKQEKATGWGRLRIAIFYCSL
jgi:hypothetical protein